MYKNEITLFRSAVLQALGKEGDVLFHNHIDQKFRYSYPLIQYKRINGKAAIVAINEGTDAIGKLFSNFQVSFSWKESKEEVEIESIHAFKYLVQSWNSSFYYYLRKWLPLNQENYEKFQAIENELERLEFLENILVGNILSFAKGVGITLESEVFCKIMKLGDSKIEKYKNVKMMSFDVEFKTNVSLPNFVGIGKGASLNFGTIVNKKKQIENK